VQATSQHTLPAPVLTQLPLLHWSAAVHVVPFAADPAQIPAAQLPLAHAVDAVHAAPAPSVGTHARPPSTAPQ
jgi:hypothetical protein